MFLLYVHALLLSKLGFTLTQQGQWGGEGEGELQNTITQHFNILCTGFALFFASYHLDASVQPRYSNFR